MDQAVAVMDIAVVDEVREEKLKHDAMQDKIWDSDDVELDLECEEIYEEDLCLSDIDY